MANTGCVNCEESRLETRAVVVLWQGLGVGDAATVMRAESGGGKPWTKMTFTSIVLQKGMIISVIMSSDCEHGQLMGQQPSVPELEAQGQYRSH